MKFELTKRTDQLLQLEALVPRLKRSHPAYQELYHTFGKDLAGYLGEKNLRYYFEFIQAEKGIHFSGLRLKGSTYFVQIDHLIATPEQLFIIEGKHRKGLILKNQHGQYVQQYQQNSVTFDNPENQAEIQKRQLNFILRRHGFPTIPITPIIAFSHNTAQLDSTITAPNVMVAQETPFFINETLAQDRRTHYTVPQLNQLKKTLKKLHEPRLVNLIEENNIQKEDLNPGVLCPSCRNEYAQRNYAIWTCGKCGTSDRSMHIQALKDYAHLYRATINNRTARWWLGVGCKSLTHRLLAELPTVESVGKKAVNYDLKSIMSEI